MDITNRTRKPLSIPLSGGKRLFLGPGKTGQVSPKALQHPVLAKLIEDGDIETSAAESKHREGDAGNTGASLGSRHSGTIAKRQSGDR